MNSFSRLVIAVVSTFSCVLCLGAQIFYPGTFDPFHNTHYHEVIEAQRLVPGSPVAILPIDKAYYNTLADGSTRPFLLNYQTRVSLIDETFEGHRGIATSTMLQSVVKHVFEELKALARQSEDPECYLLIGVDVLDIWKDLDGFDELRRVYRFLVSKDVRKPELTQYLEHHFALDPGFTFFAPDALGIRSSVIIKKLLMRDHGVAELLPGPVLRYLTDVGKAPILLAEYWSSCVSFVTSVAKIALSARLGTLSQIEQDEVRLLVEGYLYEKSANVSARVQKTFDDACRENEPKGAQLRSELRFFKDWYQASHTGS